MNLTNDVAAERARGLIEATINKARATLPTIADGLALAHTRPFLKRSSENRRR